jgi:hypothetical protein
MGRNSPLFITITTLPISVRYTAECGMPDGDE